jgi:hypothetical protein
MAASMIHLRIRAIKSRKSIASFSQISRILFTDWTHPILKDIETDTIGRVVRFLYISLSM